MPYRHIHCLPAVHPSSALPQASCFPPLRCVYRCISTKNGKQSGRQRRGVRMTSYADCTEECSVVCSISVIVVIFEYFFNHFLYVLQALSTLVHAHYHSVRIYQYGCGIAFYHILFYYWTFKSQASMNVGPFHFMFLDYRLKGWYGVLY